MANPSVLKELIARYPNSPFADVYNSYLAGIANFPEALKQEIAQLALSPFYTDSLINAFVETNFSETLMQSLIDCFKELKNMGINISELFLENKLTYLFQELRAFHQDLADIPDFEAFCKLYFNSCLLDSLRNERSKVRAVKTNLINQTLAGDAKFLKAIIQAPTENSAYVSLMKTIGPKITELRTLIQGKKSFLVLRKYKEILDLCNLEGLDPSLNNEALKDELAKRFPKEVFVNQVGNYRKAMANHRYTEEENFGATNFFATLNYSSDVAAIQRVLYDIMHKYYEETKCFYRQTKVPGLNVYYLNDLMYITYEYDELPGMTLKSGALELGWEDRDYWVKILTADLLFVPGENMAFLEGEELECYQIMPTAFNQKLTSYFSQSSSQRVFEPQISFKEVINPETSKAIGRFEEARAPRMIYGPESYLEEVIAKSLSNEETGELDPQTLAILTRYGLDPKVLKNDNVIGNETFYFKNPRAARYDQEPYAYVDDLKVRNEKSLISKYRFLGLIKNSTSRPRTMATLRTKVEKDPKPAPKSPELPPAYAMRKTWAGGPRRLPYNDN